MRVVRRQVSGVLLLDKSIGCSSNHALQAAKRAYRAQKAGHAGTLDPLASGLLPVFFGEATRFSGYLLDADKRYLADISLGSTTRTGDAEGEVLERHPVDVSLPQVEDVLRRFLGAQTQIPPMYSALKRDGQPLYVLARRGETVERAPRNITIRKLDLLGFDGNRLRLEVTCSKGTYIRTLAEDIGAALGCGAHLAGLRRTATGALELAQATSLESIQALSEAERDALLRPADAVLGGLPALELDERAAARFGHGQALEFPGGEPGIHRVYASQERFLGLGVIAEGGRLTAKRLLAEAGKLPPSG